MGKKICPKNRFLEKYIPEPMSGCWIWTGAVHHVGKKRTPRGKMILDRRIVEASRVAYILFKGQPGALLVLHKCDNSLCVNPDHLFLGTQAENLADMTAKGRRRSAIGSDQAHAKLTEEKVKDIRTMVSQGESQTAVAAKFGVKRNTISCIVSRQTWKHIL